MSPIPLIDRIDGNSISLAMLLIISIKVATGDDRSTPQFRLFLGLLVLTIAELILDNLSWVLDGLPWARLWLTIVYLLYYGIQPVITFLWVLYADYQIFFDARRTRRLALVLSPPLMAHTMLTLVSPATGWVFFLDGSNVYSRGNLFVASAAIPFLYLGYTFVSAVIHWPRIAARSRFTVLFFAVPPMLGGIVQARFFGVTLLWPGVALSLLMVYLSIESDLLITDHLTGLHNRRSFDRHLARRLKHSPADRLFGVVMLDLDGFKLINDRFGHAQGDEALVETAGVLRRCLHANDFIARFAGDEFVVVADLRCTEDADILCARMEESFRAFNRESGRPWMLAASIGAAVRVPSDGKTAEALVAEADAMMYRDKDA